MTEVRVTETAHAALVSAARGAHPMETGGILVGMLADGDPWITQVVEIKPDRPNSSRYLLPPNVTATAVDDARKIDPRVGYLGEWHSHPVDVGPSLLDKITMARVALRNPPGQPSPLLIIARYVRGLHTLDPYTFRLTARRAKLTLTGEPPLSELTQ